MSGLRRHPPHQFRKSNGATVTFVQLHGTGTEQIVRVVPSPDHQHMTDEGLLELYSSPEPRQVVGSRIDEIMARLATHGR